MAAATEDRSWTVEECLVVMRSHAQHDGCMFDNLARTLERTAAERDALAARLAAMAAMGVES